MPPRHDHWVTVWKQRVRRIVGRWARSLPVQVVLPFGPDQIVWGVVHQPRSNYPSGNIRQAPQRERRQHQAIDDGKIGGQSHGGEISVALAGERSHGGDGVKAVKRHRHAPGVQVARDVHEPLAHHAAETD
jgi:hypothetical protein